jgi:broad-specificity NMP kinase
VTTVLLTGMSGTGKSTVLGELASRGYRVVDLDDGHWSVGLLTADGSAIEQLWREDRVSELLASGPEAPQVVAGCASNQGRFYDRFAAVVLLSAPVDVLRERLATRDSNDFGKDPAELERILGDLATVEPLLRATSALEVDTTVPVSEVTDAVEALLTRTASPPESAETDAFSVDSGREASSGPWT